MPLLPAFLKLKTVPRLAWSAERPLTLQPRLKTLLVLAFGLFLFGLGEALLVASGSGVSPWTVFAQGIAQAAGWSIGFTTFVVSIAVLLCWIPLRQTPGIGTVLNAIIIALVLEYILPLLPHQQGGGSGLAVAVSGVVLTGIGGGIYLIANLGPGPRDGLMTGLQRLTGLPVAWVRAAIELTVLLIGWLLGGVAGIGTLLFAFGIGPSVAATLYVMQHLHNRSNTPQGKQG